MQTIQLSGASLASLIHDLEHAADTDQSVSFCLENGLTVKIGGGLWSPPIGGPDPVNQPTLYPYLDLSTALLPAHELRDIEQAPPTVIPHEYGAWIHVMDDDDWPQEEPTSTTPPPFAHLRAVLEAASALGAQWINLDSDGLDVLESLPTFEH